MRSRASVVCLLAALFVPRLLGQQPTFRTGVDLVEIDAVVTDAQGNPVTGLTAEDFEVREGGKPQAIAAFSEVAIPIERADRPLFSPAAIEPDVQTNQDRDGRIYLIAFDGISPMLALRTRNFLRRFIEQHVGANDVVGISYLDRGSSNSQEFTSNKRILLSALDRFTGVGQGAGLPSAAFRSSGAVASPTTAVPSPTAARRSLTEDAFGSSNAMRTFREITEFMVGVPGRRKAMLLVTTGSGLVDMFGVTDYNGGTMSLRLEAAHAAMQAASRGNVSIYPIDPRGLTVDGDITDDAAPSDDEQRQASTAGLQTRANLRQMAEMTGGFAFIGQNSFDQAFTRLVRENSAYYVLGFYSTDERRDGRFRKVQVQVKRQGLEVRARSGYVAPTGRAPRPADTSSRLSPMTPAVGDAFSSPIARPAVPMKLFAAAYKGTDEDANITVAIEIDPSQLDLVERDGTFAGGVEFVTGATSAGKTLAVERRTATLALTPENYERGRRDGYRILTDMTLPPGRYQIHAAIGNRASSKAGSVVYDLDVPDFTKGGLIMSSVSLSAASSSPSVRVRDPLRDALPDGPATARTFDSSDTLTLFAEVYDNLRTSGAHSVDLSATLRTEEGLVIRTAAETRSSAELQGASGGYGFKAELPLEGAAPGIHVIRVEARANAGDRPAVSRDVQIRIR
jgi:VWFA-related protein